jgi:hypothetical protein
MRVPKGKRIMSKQNEISKFYQRREINLLAEYLGRRDTLPASLHDPKALNPVPKDWDEAKQGIGIHEGAPWACQDATRYALSNAVARICLSTIQEHLPQFAVCRGDEVKLGRKIKELRELPERILLPLPLFTINWANTAPGLCWPEAYHVTHLPEWDVYIVTGSQDSDEIYGYEDFAVGWFDERTTILHGAREVLISYWENLRDEWSQERWEELLDVYFGDPEEWTDEVWPSEDEEDEPPRKTPTDVNRNAGSALTLEADDVPSLRKERGDYC